MGDRCEDIVSLIFVSFFLLLILWIGWLFSKAAVCVVQTSEFSINWVSVHPLPPIKWNISLSIQNPNRNYIISSYLLTIWVLHKGNFLVKESVKPFVLQPQFNRKHVIDNVQIVAPPAPELEAVIDEERNRNGIVSFHVTIQGQMAVLSSGFCQPYYGERKNTVSCEALKVQFISDANRGIFSEHEADQRCSNWAY